MDTDERRLGDSGSPRQRRTTDSELALPSARRAFAVLPGLIRLRCPNCRRGKILRRWFGMRERCAACGFRYERSDENYFQGAMFVNFMLGGFTFAAGLVATLVLSWPNVPEKALMVGAPVVMVVYSVLLYPVSKVVWLTADVMIRPITSEEFD